MEFALPLLTIMSSLLTGIIIFFIREDNVKLRSALNLAGASAKLVLVMFMIFGVYSGINYGISFRIMPGIELKFVADSLSMLFVTLSALLWFLTTIYAIGYLEHYPNRNRFFGFFSLCVTSTMGIAMAGNLFTFFFFYEFLTITTYPLVVHNGTEEAKKAGNTYLKYTLSGGLVFLTATIWFYTIAGNVDFIHGGIFNTFKYENRFDLIIIFYMLIVGMGVKAAIFPLHGWLPKAMVAPAPVSALLHAVAVVKAGAFGIIRVVYDVYGIEFSYELGLLYPLMIIACITIIYGSVQAVFQDNLKKMLAYSTISQVSYIILGVAIFGPIASVGGIVHLVHQGLMKITLFFAAGIIAETVHFHKISELDGVAKRLPLTMAVFSIGAFGMIGLPPLAGFVSKWYLGTGAVNNGYYYILPVLIGSTFLNALYFFPVLYRAYFKAPSAELMKDFKPGCNETNLLLLFPALLTAFLVIFTGVFANSEISPLEYTKLIIERAYVR